MISRIVEIDSTCSESSLQSCPSVWCDPAVESSTLSPGTPPHESSNLILQNTSFSIFRLWVPAANICCLSLYKDVMHRDYCVLWWCVYMKSFSHWVLKWWCISLQWIIHVIIISTQNSPINCIFFFFSFYALATKTNLSATTSQFSESVKK